MKSKHFRSVWYRRDEPLQNLTMEEAFKRERGCLEITSKDLQFKSSRSEFVIQNVLSLECGPQGSDPVNAWIKVSYTEDGIKYHAYFADGRFFGFAGFFGGTSRILKGMSHLAQVTHQETKELTAFKFTLVILLALLLLTLFLL